MVSLKWLCHFKEHLKYKRMTPELLNYLNKYLRNKILKLWKNPYFLLLWHQKPEFFFVTKMFVKHTNKKSDVMALLSVIEVSAKDCLKELYFFIQVFLDFGFCLGSRDSTGLVKHSVTSSQSCNSGVIRSAVNLFWTQHCNCVVRTRSSNSYLGSGFSSSFFSVFWGYLPWLICGHHSYQH